MIKTIVLSVLIIAIAVVLLSVKLIFKRNGKFASQHIDDNAELQKKGIRCVMEQDGEARAMNRAY